MEVHLDVQTQWDRFSLYRSALNGKISCLHFAQIPTEADFSSKGGSQRQNACVAVHCGQRTYRCLKRDSVPGCGCRPVSVSPFVRILKSEPADDSIRLMISDDSLA